jgi:uncharacterized HAD superfamily protein
MTNRDIYLDLDGTIANASWRQHYVRTKPKNWKLFNESMKDDPPYPDIIWLVKTLKAAGNRIIICTGRTEDFRDVTVEWLKRHDVPYDALYMRPAGDYRDDSIVKLELVQWMRDDGFDPTIALDDRNRVVDALRAIGIRVLQVQPGDF